MCTPTRSAGMSTCFFSETEIRRYHHATVLPIRLNPTVLKSRGLLGTLPIPSNDFFSHDLGAAYPNTVSLGCKINW